MLSTRNAIANSITMTTDPHKKDVNISVVVPVVERFDDVEAVYKSYSETLNQRGISFEFVFVVDGGEDRVIRVLEGFVDKGEPIRIVSLPALFGESTALTVGFEQARGEYLITLPAYFQTAPEGIHKVIDLLYKGIDLVVTKRWPRIDTWVNRLQTRCFSFLTKQLTGIHLTDFGSGLRGLHRQVARELQIYGDLHRFLPLLAYQKGFRVVEVNIPQHPADGSRRIYRPGVYVRRILDLLTVMFLFKFTKKPLRFFGLIGAGLFASGFVISLVLAIEKLLGGTALADRPLLVLGILLMVLGVQVGSIGLLGEIIIFTHARKFKDYTIRKVFN